MPSTWDAAIWDTDEWAPGPPPSQGWGQDWRWWWQVGSDPASIIDLMGLVVEARWTSDSHKLGDGTFRGDLQPGTCTVRLWDPAHKLDNLNKLGAVWALYQPTGACWCWFYESLSRGLYAPGDPADADAVFVGTPWPTRLTTPRWDGNFPQQSAAARMAAIVNLLNTANPSMSLPVVTGNIAGQGQIVPAIAYTTTDPFNQYPDLLTQVRTAAADGVAWWTPTAGATGVGALTLNYGRWEAANVRPLGHSQVIAGPATTADLSIYLSFVNFATVNGATAAAYNVSTLADLAHRALVGFQGPNMRFWGDANINGNGAEQAALITTANNLINDRSNPSELLLSSVDVQSGGRTGPAGGPSSAEWDPYGHTFSPIDVAAVADTGDILVKNYRVQQSSHRLTANIWQTTHTLDKYTAAAPLP